MIFKDAIEIQSSRLILKPFEETDADEIYGCITHSLTRYMSWEPPKDRAHFAEICQTWIRNIADDSDYVFVIRNKSNNHFLGLSGFHQNRGDYPELGIWIREDQHGYGFGREAVTAVVEWASINFDQESFIYPVAMENYPSRRIAESLGGVEMYCSQTPKYLSITYFIPNKTNNT